MKSTHYLKLIVCLFAFSSVYHSNGQTRNLLINSYDNIIKLDFSNGSPVVNYTGVPDGFEAISHVEDPSGNILFFVNANGVFRGTTQTIMPGSVGMLASPSSAEVVICPNPANSLQYYVIHNSETCSQLYYCIVDMSLAGGQGDVIQLNTPIDQVTFSEGLEIIQVPCQNKYWLVGYACEYGLKRFTIDSSGISNGQVIFSHAPPNFMYDGRSELDYHSGRIGISFSYSNDALLGDFDPQTGIFTNPVLVNLNSFTTYGGFYGVEFSPDGSKVYMSAWYENFENNFFQYDFNTGASQSFFLNSTLAPGTNFDGPGQIELGPDGNLYVVHDGGYQIHVISQPNSLNPSFSKITTNSVCALGISDPIQSNVSGITNNFVYADVCLGDVTHFSGTMNTCYSGPVSWHWNFGEPSSGAANISTLQHPVHQYASVGSYTVSLIINSSSSSDTIVKVIQVGNVHAFHLPDDTTICNGSYLTIQVPFFAGVQYAWSNGDTGRVTNLHMGGMHILSIHDGGCTTKDTIQLTIVGNIVPFLANDMYLCPGDSLALIDWSNPVSQPDILWSTGETAIDMIIVSAPGIYWVELSELGCTARDSITILSTASITNLLGNDTTICDGESVTLHADPLFGFVVWDSVIFGFYSYVFSTPGIHTIDAYIGSCIYHEEISINIISLNPVDLGPDISTCNGGTVALSSPSTLTGNFHWSTGAVTPSIDVSAGDYWLSVSSSCGNETDSVHIGSILYPVSSIPSEINSCGPVNETVSTGNTAYAHQWSTGEITSAIHITHTGVYTVSIDNQGCVTNDTFTVNAIVFKDYEDMPNIFTPDNDGANDYLFYEAYELSSSFHIDIFDRWGKKIISSDNAVNTWSGEGQAAGVYYYILRFADPCLNDVIKEKKGFIQLIR
ncbi:MAG: hypothetical protein K0S33_1175 [Bacteroidetes bacterium]|jgi:gliding motility-associated-like protein|nr:hypothetical protein [Bacteroidota bacterium]